MTSGCLLTSFNIFAQAPSWDLKALAVPPKIQLIDTREPGVKAFFYESVPWKGKPTRIFAYYGVPAGPEATKFPAVVLVHGGQGSAYAEWVRLWNKRGYAAIAMDHFGNIPGIAPSEDPYQIERTRNPDGGPTGDGGFAQVDEPIADQWPYQGVAAIILANSLLRSFPEIDADRIGLSGISWGGYLASITAGVDSRFRFVVPVYGCGYIGEDPSWPPDFHNMTKKKAEKWSRLWDPSHFLPQAKMPMLWVNGTNDVAFPLSAWEKSTELPQGPQTLSLHLDLSHGQSQGATPEEIFAFAGGVLKLNEPLAKVGPIKRPSDDTLTVDFEASVPIVTAVLCHTSDSGPWKDRRWEKSPATLLGNTAQAKLPPASKAYFFNLIDERGLVVSSRYQTAEGP